MGLGADDVTLWEIVEEHLDEAAFLYGMRKARLVAPHYNLEEVRVGPEARLLAHIDALVVGGTAVRDRLLVPTIQDDEAEPERVTAAGLAMLKSEPPQLASELLVAALLRATGERVDALGAALSLAEVPDVPTLVVKELRKEHAPAATAAMLRVLAAHRSDPGELIFRLLQSDDPAIVQAALAVAGAVPRGDCLALCEYLIDSDVAATRDAAIDAALVMGSSLAWSVCVHRATRPTKDDAHCLLLSGLLGSAHEHRTLAEHLQAGTEPAAVLWAIGFAGRAEPMPTVVALLEQPDERVAKLAGEAFTAVTGYTPAKQGAAQAKAKDRAAEPTEEPVPFDEEDLDADLAPSDVDLLPLLDAADARVWWNEHRGQFGGALRYCEGQSMSLGTMHRTLSQGPARRREAWYLGVSIASGGRYVISAASFCERQLTQLHWVAQSDPGVLSRLFH
jgi:uncharacterized protein (TIGR02270 family)